MKHLLLSAFLIGGITSTGAAQSAAKPAAGQKVVSLSGNTGAIIKMEQIKEQPIVRALATGDEITAFDFAWTIKAGAGSEYMGPYSNVGNRLSPKSLADILRDAEKGLVTRIYIDGIVVRSKGGTSRKLEGGASYKVGL